MVADQAWCVRPVGRSRRQPPRGDRQGLVSLSHYQLGDPHASGSEARSEESDGPDRVRIVRAQTGDSARQDKIESSSQTWTAARLAVTVTS